MVLRLVLVNLISNAVKFTRTRSQAEIEIGCTNQEKDQVVLFIRDNGVGFDMKYANKLFGVFQRLQAPGSGWLPFNVLCIDMEAESGPRVS